MDLTNHKNYGLVNGEIKLIDFGLTYWYMVRCFSQCNIYRVVHLYCG